MKQASLKKNFIFSLIIQIVNLAVPLITTPYIARTLGEVGNGRYSYAYSLTTYFVLFANLGFNVYGQREIAKSRDDKYSKSKIFIEILCLKAIFAILSTIAFVFSIIVIGFGEHYNLLLLILSSLVLFSIFDITYYINGTENFKALAIRNLLVKIVSLALVFLFVKDKDDVWIYTLCITISTLFGYFVMWPSLRKNICKVKFKEINLKKHIKPAMLIFLPTLAVTIYSVFDKTMIGLLSPNPDYDNGCYEQAHKINSIILTFLVIISTIMSPRNANDYANGNIDSMNEHVKFSLSYVLCLAFPLIFAFIILGGNLSSWFLGNGYNEVPIILSIMSVRYVFSSIGVIFSEEIFIIVGKEKFCTIATTCAAITNVILNFFLIRSLGAIGAAISTAISEIVCSLVLFIIAIKENYIKLNYFINVWKFLIASGIMAIPVYLLNLNLNYSIFSFAICTIVGIITYGIILIILKDEFTLNIIKIGISIIKSKLIRGRNKNV